jgi:hypothetical protein
MRRALQDQLRAIEQLNQISQRANAPRDVVRPELPSGARTPVSLTSALVQQQGPPASRGKGQPSQDGRESWSLGDLLARASHEDEAQAAQAQVQPQAQTQNAPPNAAPARLDIATIARALDPATASAIWGRIRAGQRNVMVRSIYAPEARALFDQISNRVRMDRDLEQSIFRYLTDFERIIKDAEARDPSGRTAQNHLVSETGRVYLFLAHAAGRIR